MHENPEEKLFTIFPPVSDDQWEELIKKDLKGADYEKKLTWLTPEGIRLRPYYTAADLEETGHIFSGPGRYPFARGSENPGSWLVRQDISVQDAASANAKAVDALMKGASSIGFIMDDTRSYSTDDLSLLLKDICLASAEINFVTGSPDAGLPEILGNECAARGGVLNDVHGSAEYDPLGALFTSGSFPGGDESRCFYLAASLVENAARLPNFAVLNVNAAIFHDAGGSAVQELAFAMASAAGYLERLTEKGISAEKAAGKIRFTFAAGSNYFMEIAKFRAARYLWTKVLEAWSVDPGIAGRMFIHAVTSQWNKTIYDPHVNMLRATSEAMAAILGGADSLAVAPFDQVFTDGGTPFSVRIARNTQLVIREEAYFDKVADPAAGSYYIESLTASLIGHSWKLFLETTDQGGITGAFGSGWMQDKLEETAGRRDQHIASRRDVLVGTNQFADPAGKVSGKIDPSLLRPLMQADRKGPGRPVRIYRGAQAFEELRLKTEKFAGGPPGVFLLTYGNPVMRKARAAFSAGFFGCAGFELIENAGFSDPLEGAKAALASKASVVVVCSSDEEYPLIVPAIAGALGDRAIIVVAGYPKENIEELRKCGVKHFIHVRSDVLETLRQFQEELGIL